MLIIIYCGWCELARFMFERGAAPAPIPKKETARRLPEIYEDWMRHRRDAEGICDQLICNTRSVLGSFHDWLEENGIGIESLRIEDVDEFLACLCEGLSHLTGRSYRGILRGFSSWAHGRRLVCRDLAPLIVGPLCYSRAKPPTFLRADEVKRLFECFAFRRQGGWKNTFRSPSSPAVRRSRRAGDFAPSTAGCPPGTLRSSR